MFIDCPSCGSSYNVADEKVRGRRVRVRCRNCGHAILVDGRAPAAAPLPQPAPAPRVAHEDATRQLSPDDATRSYGHLSSDFDGDEQTRVFSASRGFDLAPATSAAAAEWTVNLSDTDQQNMSTEAIVDAYNAGLLPDDAYVWKAGMDDWVPAMDVPAIRDAINDAGHTRVVDSEFIDEPEYVDEPDATVSYTPSAARAPAYVPPPAAPRIPPPAAPAVPPPVAYAPPAAPPSSSGRAARSPGPPSAQDLFGSVQVAGSEQELLSSQAETALERYDQKPTGARGDSSVLFSMDAFRRGQTGPGGPPPPTDRADAALDMGAPTAAPSLGGGSAAMLTAPAAPSQPPPPRAQIPTVHTATRDTTPPAAAASAKKSSGTMVYVLVGVVGLALMLGGVWFFVVRPRSAGPPIAIPEPAPTTAAAEEEPEAKEEPKAEEEEEEEPEAKEEPKAEEEEEPEEDEEPKEEAPAPAAPAPAAAPRSAPAAAVDLRSPSPAPAPAPEPEPEPEPEKPSSSLLAAMKGAAGDKVVLEEDAPKEEPKEEPEKVEAPPFNVGAAKAALSAASAGAAACKTPDGPTGSGKVQVTFASSGRVTSTNIVSGPFVGTSVGGCVARRFRAARVPAFSGDPVSVAKSFRIPD